MTNKKYFVSTGGENLGPYEMEIIVQKIEKAELKATDHIFADDKGDWIMICQHAEFLARAQKSKPAPKPMAPPPGFVAPVPAPAPAAPVASVPTAAAPLKQVDLSGDMADDGNLDMEPVLEMVIEPRKTVSPAVATPAGTGDQEWYVLKGKDRFGPFSFMDLVHMLQDKSLFEYDYVWRQSMATWARIAEVMDFNPDRMRALLNTKEAKSEGIFSRRKHDRWKYQCSIIVHDNSKIWRGHTLEMSEGGAGVIIHNAMLVPGQNIYIHFKPGNQTQPFNVLCEVVSKRFDKGVKVPDAPIVYGLKFINIQKQDKDELKTLQAAAS